MNLLQIRKYTPHKIHYIIYFHFFVNRIIKLIFSYICVFFIFTMYLTQQVKRIPRLGVQV